jgi:hypothetical protein
MRSAYYELKPLFHSKGHHTGEARHAKIWLKGVHRTAADLLDAKAQPGELLEALSSGTDYELLLLRPLFACPRDRRVRRRGPGHCPNCDAALEVSMELDPAFINELCVALKRYPDGRYRWRKLVRDIAARAAVEQRRHSKRGRKNDPLLKMLVDRLIRIFDAHTAARTSIAKSFPEGKYGGQCFNFVCWALPLFGLRPRNSSVGTYFEQRYRRRAAG